MDVTEASPHRVTPPCLYADICGGCGWQHISYDCQLIEKRENVISQN